MRDQIESIIAAIIIVFVVLTLFEIIKFIIGF